ncbi:MAG: GlsB/YeaQ/YmgE family stress response membrane protein [Balneolales bacterium]
MSLLWFLLVGLIAGWIAGLIMRGEGFGIIGNLVVGVLGALVGGYLFEWLNITPDEGFWGALVTSLAGAIVFLTIIRLIKRS